MKRTFLAGILAVALSMAASGSTRASTEINTAFVPEDPLDQHRIVARSCEEPRSFRRIEMKGGTKFAREGEVFAFEPREIRAGRCEEVEIVLENTDAVRHALMLPGLNPMFTLEFTGRGIKSLRFVTPDEDVTLDLLRKSGEHLLQQEVFYGTRNQVYDGVQARGGAPGAKQWPATG